MTKNEEQHSPERILSLIDEEDHRGITAYLAKGGSLKPALEHCLESRLYLILEGWAYFEHDEFIKTRKAWSDVLSLMEAAGFSGGTEGASPQIIVSTQPCKKGEAEQ